MESESENDSNWCVIGKNKKPNGNITKNKSKNNITSDTSKPNSLYNTRCDTRFISRLSNNQIFNKIKEKNEHGALDIGIIFKTYKVISKEPYETQTLFEKEIIYSNVQDIIGYFLKVTNEDKSIIAEARLVTITIKDEYHRKSGVSFTYNTSVNRNNYNDGIFSILSLTSKKEKNSMRCSPLHKIFLICLTTMITRNSKEMSVLDVSKFDTVLFQQNEKRARIKIFYSDSMDDTEIRNLSEDIKSLCSLSRLSTFIETKYPYNPKNNIW